MNGLNTIVSNKGGGPQSTTKNNQTLNVGPNNILSKVNTGTNKDWYEKKKPVKPRVYHKYFKGCKEKDEEVKDPETGKDPNPNPPEGGDTPPTGGDGDGSENQGGGNEDGSQQPLTGGVVIDTED